MTHERFWMPDESGMGGEWRTPGQVFIDPDTGRRMVQLDKFVARPATVNDNFDDEDHQDLS